MPDRIALKRLTASDLTFFERLFKSLNVGNQKSINLNADVFIEKFYPTLPDQVSVIGDVITVSLAILGPSGAPPYVLSRAITKRAAYKNWRLNGEFIYDPPGETGRFDDLTAGDLAVLEFVGDPAPQKITLLLISSKSLVDAQLHSKLSPLVPGGRRTMVEVSRNQLTVALASTPTSHPVWSLAENSEVETALEDVALGGAIEIKKLTDKTPLLISAATLAAAKATAEKNGREGEALAWLYLKKMQHAGGATDIEWASEANAVSSYDFSAMIENSKRYIDAKSTSGGFQRLMHMSIAELQAAAQLEHYDLWRVYNLNQDGARLRICQDIGVSAQNILAGITLPQGITVDSVSIDPSVFAWGEEITIARPEEEEGEE